MMPLKNLDYSRQDFADQSMVSAFIDFLLYFDDLLKCSFVKMCITSPFVVFLFFLLNFVALSVF